MKGATFTTRGRKISFPPGISISHLAEIESPRGGNISAGGETLYGGDFILGHRQIHDFFIPATFYNDLRLTRSP